MNRRRVLELATLSFGGIAGCVSGPRGRLSGPAAGERTRRWTTDVGATIRARPLLYDDSLFVMTPAEGRSQTILEVDTAAGEIRSRTTLQTYLEGGWTLLDGTAYGATNGTVWALDLDALEVAWTVALEAGDQLVVSDDRIYAFSLSTYVDEADTPDVAVIDRTTGARLDRAALPQVTRALAAPGDGAVLVGTAAPRQNSGDPHDAGHVRRFDADSFDQQWTHPTPRDPHALALDDNQLVVGGDVAAVTALSATDGTEQWTADVQPRAVSHATFDGAAVYLGNGRHTLYALARTDGTKRWTYDALPNRPDATGPSMTGPMVIPDGVYMSTTGGNAYVLDPDEGTLRWSFTGRKRISHRPAVDGDTIYLADDPGHIYALEKH